jgi:hypothetical protein
MEYYRSPTEMRLLDIRFLQMLIPYIFVNRKEPINGPTTEWYKKLCATFGGCSAIKQLKILNEFAGGRAVEPVRRLERFLEQDQRRNVAVSPIEVMGFRVGITDLDYSVIAVLSSVFNQLDGFIAPNMFSPSHDQFGQNNLLPELILFHPKRSLEVITEPDWSSLPIVALESIIQPTCDMVFKPTIFASHQVFVHRGGGDRLWTEREEYEKKLRKSKRLQARYDKYREFGKTIVLDMNTTLNQANMPRFCKY